MKTSTRWLLIFVFVACQVAAFFLLFPNPAYADDCLRDPLNAADCMRTGGARQIGSVLISMAGTLAATLVSTVSSSASTAATAASAAIGSVSSTVEGAVEGAAVTGAAGPPPADLGDLSESDVWAISNAAQAAAQFGQTPEPPPAPEPPLPQPPVDVNPPVAEPVSAVEGQTPQLPPEPPAAPTPAPVEGTPAVLQGAAVIPVIPGLPGIDLSGPLKDLVEGMLKTGEQTGKEIIKDLPGWVDSGPFDILKNAVGTSSTLAGTLKEYVQFVESPETIQALHDALRAWQNNPTAEAAEDYLKQLGKTTDSQLGKLADGLDLASKGIDVVEAVGKGLTEAEKEGFTGGDKALIIGAEIGKKGLTWMLTKNPVVGALDWATGTTTQALWGKEGRVDIGGLVDKAGDNWKDTVKEYAYNTGGGADADASSQTADQFLSSVRRIKQQVDSGKITREEGSARAHKLQQILMGGAQ